jgi:hypothetical protein
MIGLPNKLSLFLNLFLFWGGNIPGLECFYVGIKTSFWVNSDFTQLSKGRTCTCKIYTHDKIVFGASLKLHFYVFLWRPLRLHRAVPEATEPEGSGFQINICVSKLTLSQDKVIPPLPPPDGISPEASAPVARYCTNATYFLAQGCRAYCNFMITIYHKMHFLSQTISVVECECMSFPHARTYTRKPNLKCTHR